MLVSLAVIWILVIPTVVVALACLRARWLSPLRRVVAAELVSPSDPQVTSQTTPRLGVGRARARRPFGVSV